MTTLKIMLIITTIFTIHIENNNKNYNYHSHNNQNNNFLNKFKIKNKYYLISTKRCLMKHK